MNFSTLRLMLPFIWSFSVTNSAILLANQSLIPSLNAFVDVEIDTSLNLVTITMTTNQDRSIGVGFNNTVMVDTYAIIYSSGDPFNTAEEYFLGQYFPGTLLTNSLTLVSDDVDSNNVRTVIVQRDIVGLSSSHYDFSGISDGSINFVNIIYGIGPGIHFSYHGTNRGTKTLTFESNATFSPRM